MLEGEVLNLAMGELGGVFCLGVGVGVFLSWGFFKPNILEKQEQITKRLRDDMNDQDRECKEKILRLEKRVDYLISKLIEEVTKPKSIILRNKDDKI